MKLGELELNKIYYKDCRVGMENIPDKSIDMIFCDLPYGSTCNTWDKIIPMHDYVNKDNDIIYEDEYILKAMKEGYQYKEAKWMFDSKKKKGLWTHYERIIKDNGVILLWAQAPFDKLLAGSQMKLFRYEWIIEKTRATGHLNAHTHPMKAHESLLVFYKKQPIFHPQKTKGHAPMHNYTKHKKDGSNYGKTKVGITGGGSTERFPRDVLQFKWDTQKSKLHPTQKPLEACLYFIKTYTNEGMIVLDNCCGSGTTCLAAQRLNRYFIGFENDIKIYLKAVERLENDSIFMEV